MDNSDYLDAADISQISNKSFLTSLGDDELIDFINKLSQRKPKEGTTVDTDYISTDILPPSSPRIEAIEVEPSSSDPSESSLSLSIPLAQPQAPIEFDLDDIQNEDEYETNIDMEDEPEKGQIFGDYATYFEAKARNQQLKDEEFVQWERERLEKQGIDNKKTSEIFKGCIIHVNGHTKPGISTLHKLVILNGGRFIHHLSAKGNATHIIASRITPRKQLEFKNYKVIRPEWIIDSIEKGELVNWHDYSVIDVDYGQTRLPFQNQIIPEGDEVEEDDEKHHDDENSIGLVNDDGESPEDDDEESSQAAELFNLTQAQIQKPVSDELDVAIDAKHPDFLKTFFAKSRLHHLSTWKSELRSEFLKLALETSSKRKPQTTKYKVIIHVDFDCFFATASALKFPNLDFQNKPVCVSHGKNTDSVNSTADIASCNYVCRKYGIKNGMWVRSAKKLCPDLICLDYDFEAYERISKRFYEILVDLKPDSLFPVSIDEALLDITSLVYEDNIVEGIDIFSKNLRERILKETGCSVSIGASHNVLLAKLALRKAKPQGQYYLHENIEEFLDDVDVRHLPGAGYSTEAKLMTKLQFKDTSQLKVRDLKTLSISSLETLFGVKTGRKLYEYARGIDHSSIDISKNPQEFMRKSVSIDVNWGIRFSTIAQVDDFLFRLAIEIAERLNKTGMCTSKLVIKILKRAKDAPIDPPKYMGCGKCDSFSKSSRLGVPTSDHRLIGTEARSMFRHIGCDPAELRGVSLSAQSLVNKADVGNQQKLPFAKVTFDVFKRKQVLAADPIKVPVEEVNRTQFEVPSDIDSSVLEVLPSSIKKDIEEQREKNRGIVSEIPKEVDLKVFNELPSSIQDELRDELRRRNIKINPQTPKKDKSSYLQQVFPVVGSDFELIRVKSPRKKAKSPPKKKSPIKVTTTRVSPMKVEKYDEEVLKELPPSISEKIIKEWQTYEEANKTEAFKFREAAHKNNPFATGALNHDAIKLEEFHQLQEPLKFQKKHRPKDILQLIEKWILHTKLKGPHSKDLKIFKDYMNDLFERNTVLHHLILESIGILFQTECDICDRWFEIHSEISTESHMTG